MMREIALDTETTGLDPKDGHRIVEIGCVEMIHRMRTGKVFHVYLNPERDVPEEATRVHGLSTDFLRDKPLFASVVAEFLDFIQDSPLVIHNAGFDMKFLNAELTSHTKSPLPAARAIDTLIMARRKFPGAPASLDALCKRFNIDLSARTKHGALLDAELLADVYVELTGGTQATMQLETAASKQRKNAKERLFREMRPHQPTAEELAAHEAFLKKIKQPVWNN